MTTARTTVLTRLAAHGRAQMWANEAEAAVLSGVSAETFRARVTRWESRGFPRINPENGKRSIPAILAFWGLPSNDATPVAASTTEDDDDGQEHWPARAQGQRLAS